MAKHKDQPGVVRKMWAETRGPQHRARVNALLSLDPEEVIFLDVKRKYIYEVLRAVEAARHQYRIQPANRKRPTKKVPA